MPTLREQWTAATIDVLVVGDQPLVRSGLAALIGACPGLAVVGAVGTGDEAIALAATRHPRVVLIDLATPATDGILTAERILAASGSRPPRVLMLTNTGRAEDVWAALRVGASGFLLKDASPEQVLAAIRAVATGCAVFAPSVTRHLTARFAERIDEDRKPDSTLDDLTRREIEVLRLVGTGLPNTAIAERLSLSEGTVKTHLHRAMVKLGVCSRPQAVVIAYETGLVTPDRARLDRFGQDRTDVDPVARADSPPRPPVCEGPHTPTGLGSDEAGPRRGRALARERYRA
ncbi:response regulator transcription factor [Nocardia sp. CDC159]|uniref:Response regulator transcription factor n=1 Tax=Nocardia pulmonis TaxID=2951408 RepID=A0A9X2E870_9NOCA|nr:MULTISPECIES: response regulator transcription factor [Nocardia]MCM6775370.1 response regulator transcription factor [Nocardia pulmonis]MCM6787896.1 response regulator transcription factor [Nocardia sp. CDC159]